MPATSPFLNPSSLPFGTFTASFGGSGTPVTYYVENFSAGANTNIVPVSNEIGATRTYVGVKSSIEGSMTLTLPSSGFPELGLSASVPAGYLSGSANTVVITKYDHSRAMGEVGKVSVNWVLLNP